MCFFLIVDFNVLCDLDLEHTIYIRASVFFRLQSGDGFYLMLMSTLKTVRSVIIFETMFLIQKLDPLIWHHSAKISKSSHCMPPFLAVCSIS